MNADLACVTLHVTAPSVSAAQALARQQGVQPVQVRRDWWGEMRARLHARAFPVAAFFRELALLLRAGLTLQTALASLHEKERRPAWAQVMQGLMEAVGQGAVFSAALARYPNVFPAVACSALESAQGASALADVLDRLAQHLEKSTELRRRVVGALLYPTLVVAVGALVTAYLMLFVVPRFAEVYRDLGAAMPWVARWLVVWADVLAAHRAVVYGVLLLVLGVAVGTVLHARLRVHVLGWILRWPAVRSRVALMQTVQLYRGLSMLLASGMPLPRALATLALGSPMPMAAQVGAARAAIESGVAVSDALYAQGLASTVSVRLIAAAEHSGGMVAAMSRLAQMHEADLERDVQWLLKVLEPLLMLAVGLVVGGVVVLLYLPIFELASVLG